MKILHICAAYPPAQGGAETYSARISQGLAARGHEVTVLTTDLSGPNFQPSASLPAEEIIDGVRVRRLPSDGGAAGSLLRFWQELPGGYRSLVKVFGQDGVEVISHQPHLPGLILRILGAEADVVSVINWYWPLAYYAYLARQMKKFTLVGIPLLHLEEPWCSTSLFKRMLASCDAVIANTSYEADYVRQLGAVRAESIGVGIEPSEFLRRNGYDPRALYQLGGLPVVGYVGRLQLNKGVATLIRAMRLVWTSRPDVRLVLAGPRITLDREIRALMEGLSNAERERIVCIYDFPESHKRAIFDALDVFAMPSTAESFGIAYLEAWMCGKPVIGARTNQIKCVIDDGVDGLLVKLGDPGETANALLELLADPKKRDEMGQHGRQKTESHFTWDKVTTKVERLYFDLIARQRHRKRP